MSPTRANVEALTDALAAFVNEIGCIDATHQEAPDLARVAAHLASRGVLVPSALTDEEANHLASIGEFFPYLKDEYGEDVYYEMSTADLLRDQMRKVACGDEGA